jgi:hypothetical protein
MNWAACCNEATVTERYRAFRRWIEPEISGRRQPDWDDNNSQMNRSRSVRRQRQSWGSSPPPAPPAKPRKARSARKAKAKTDLPPK